MTRATRTFFVCIASGVLLLLALLAAIAVYSQVRASDTFVVEGKGKLTQESERDAIVRSLSRLYEETAADRALIMGSVVSPEGVAGFIGSVESVAKRAGVVLDVGAVDLRPIQGTRFSNIMLTLQARGSWERVLRFARALENLPRGSLVRSASYEGDEKGWSASFTLETLAGN